MIGKLSTDVLIKFTISLAKDILPQLVTKVTSSILDNFDRNMHGRATGTGVLRARKGFTLFILNEDMDNIIRIIKLLEISGVLIDGVTETVNHEIKKQEVGFLATLLAPMAASLTATVTSSLIGGFFGKGVMRSGRGVLTVSNVHLKTLTILAKRLNLIAWLDPGRVSADGYITVLKFQTEIWKDVRQVKMD